MDKKKIWKNKDIIITIGRIFNIKCRVIGVNILFGFSEYKTIIALLTAMPLEEWTVPLIIEVLIELGMLVTFIVLIV